MSELFKCLLKLNELQKQIGSFLVISFSVWVNDNKDGWTLSICSKVL